MIPNTSETDIINDLTMLKRSTMGNRTSGEEAIGGSPTAVEDDSATYKATQRIEAPSTPAGGYRHVSCQCITFMMEYQKLSFEVRGPF